MGHQFTPDERDWLVGNYATMTNPEIVEGFARAFGTTLETKQVLNFAKRYGLRKTRETRNRAVSLSRGGMTAEQEQFMREFAPWHTWRETSAEYERRFGRTLKKSDVHNMKAKLGLRCEIENRAWFRPGHVPATKGKIWDDYLTPEQQEHIRRHGCFRKGELNEYNRKRKRELLDTYTDPSSGMALIYVCPRGARYGAERWIPYAQFVWMQANGREFPEDHKAVFADHNRDNFDPDNIVSVPVRVIPIVCANPHGRALPYHDRESLELAVAHATLICKRAELQRKLRERRNG